MKKIFLLLISVFLLNGLFICDIHADMGPKPSVTVYVDEDIKGPYFVTLLGNKEPYGPWSKVEAGESPKDASLKDQAFAAFSRYEDMDGYMFLGNMSDELTGTGSFAWTYYPPEEFRIAVYDAGSETILTSVPVQRTAFNSYFHVHIENGVLEVKEESHLGKELFKAVLRALLTVVVELALAYLFSYREKKQIISILLVNLITQLLLGVFLMLIDYHGGMLTWMILFPIGELAVIVLEMVLYLILFRQVKRGKLILYTIVANLLTAALTFVSVLLAWASL